RRVRSQCRDPLAVRSLPLLQRRGQVGTSSLQNLGISVPCGLYGARVDQDPIFAGLNPEQRRAVETARGPVCIRDGAGAGTTPTTTPLSANTGPSGWLT